LISWGNANLPAEWYAGLEEIVPKEAMPGIFVDAKCLLELRGGFCLRLGVLAMMVRKWRRAWVVLRAAGIVAVAMICAAATLRAQQATPQLSEDESGVYTALFQEIYQAANGRPIVLSDQTALGVPPGMLAKIPVQGLQTKEFLDKVPPEAKQDYTQSNHTSEKLPSPCHLAPECIAENAGDLALEVKNAKAWNKFFRKHPNAPGIVVVSRIGFNSAHSQAIVYTGYTCGTLCGQGEYARLVKNNGEWAVADHTVVWISQK
jgi:hypothetical protein